MARVKSRHRSSSGAEIARRMAYSEEAGEKLHRRKLKKKLGKEAASKAIGAKKVAKNNTRGVLRKRQAQKVLNMPGPKSR